MRRRHPLAALLLVAAALGLALPARADAPATPSETVEAFHKALRSDDGRAALAFLARDVTVFEQGFMEQSRDEYAAHQLTDAAKFARATERRVLRRESGQDGNLGWVISTTLTTGRFEDRTLELEGTETMLLRRENDEWKIAHIHWSAHSRADDPPAEHAAPAADPPKAAPKPAAKPAAKPAPKPAAKKK